MFEKVAWTLTVFEFGSRGANVFALGCHILDEEKRDLSACQFEQPQ